MSGPLKVSATLYTTWLTCPAQARARLDGHYPPPTIHTFRGELAHIIFARHIATGPIPADRFVRTCKEAIGSTHLNYRLRDLALRPTQVRAEIDKVGLLYDRFTTLPLHRLGYRSVETPVNTHLDDTTVLTGRIDAVTSEGTIVDWKTGELGMAADQLRFYLAARVLAGQHADSMTPTGMAVSITTGEVIHTSLTATETARFGEHLGAMLADLRNPPSTPTPGPHCRYCPISQTCPEGARTLPLIG